MQPEETVIGTESERVKAFGKVRGTIGEEWDWHRDRNRALDHCRLKSSVVDLIEKVDDFIFVVSFFFKQMKEEVTKKFIDDHDRNPIGKFYSFSFEL